MREEDIIDALDGIDDELIAEADEARKQKNKKSGRVIKSLTAIAAVLAVAVIGVYAVAVIRSDGGTDGTNSSDGLSDGYSDNEHPIPTTGVANDGNDGNRGEMLDLMSVTLKVTGWYDGGSCFMGRVTDSLDSEKLSKGMYIQVNFGETVFLETKSNGNKIQLENDPTETMIPVGSEITVRYSVLIPPPPIANGAADELTPTRGDHYVLFADTLVLDNPPELERSHTHSAAAVPQNVDDPFVGYCGNSMTTVYFPDGKVTFMAHLALTEILHNLDYDADKLCRCLPEYTVDTEFGKGYGINLTAGYARYNGGQADLTAEQIDDMLAVIEWAKDQPRDTVE